VVDRDHLMMPVLQRTSLHLFWAQKKTDLGKYLNQGPGWRRQKRELEVYVTVALGNKADKYSTPRNGRSIMKRRRKTLPGGDRGRGGGPRDGITSMTGL